ncbi:MAG: DNA-binding response regulator [Bacteroidetes bacterium 43-93]|nr:response regulator transcription factor [Bacteroidota bacterium]OJW99144.1 MAG: DNA-binding response regulator [Bacteroidetes bacterium 43-93]
MNKAAILIIDDEAQIRKLLEITLQSNDYTVSSCANARDGIVAASTHPPDLIILDLGLPDINGHEVLKQLREWFTNPIIILSVQNDEQDIVNALDNGANDYLVKPFRTGELLARIRSALRTKMPEESTPAITAGNLEIDLSLRTVRKNGDIIKLTSTEYTLLALFARNEGKVLTHHYLLREVWGPGFINQSQYLRVFIAQLRKKIEDDPNRPGFLVTESGVGYRFIGSE